MPTIVTVINKLLAGCGTLLDVGAGIGDILAALAIPVKLGLEIHRPYLEKWPRMEQTAIPLNLPASALGTVFLPKTVDAVSFIDSLEHITAAEAMTALAEAERIARRIVVVFTPRGDFPQHGLDLWGLGGETYQAHRSAWEPGDFVPLGYTVLVFPGYHSEATNPAFLAAFGPDAPPVDALLAFKRTVPPA